MEQRLPRWAVIAAAMAAGGALLFGLGLWARYGESVVLSGFSLFCA